MLGLILLAFVSVFFVVQVSPNADEQPLRAQPQTLLIGSFNMMVFGQTKLKKKNITDCILNIITRYDLVALQEIRDVSNYSAQELKRLVQEKDNDYEFIVSGQLGRTSSKEQYSFFYRRSKISAIDQYQYPDEKSDFERPPFFMRFTTTAGYPRGPVDIAFGNIHTRPESTVLELRNLTKVFDTVFWKWKPALVLMAGDMNADCAFVRKSDWSTIPVWTNSTFVWLVSNVTDTSAAASHCTYDRFIGLQNNMKVPLVPATGTSWLYYKDMGFTSEEAKTVSDHYPVEFKLQTNWF